jgi:hypothetical protein
MPDLADKIRVDVAVLAHPIMHPAVVGVEQQETV